MLLTATNYHDLISKLPSIDVLVPSRANGRKKHHTETYSIVRLLSTLPPEALEYPLSLVKRERPDFELQCPGFSIGIEHTEAISENAAKEAFLRAGGAGPNVYFTKKASISEPRKSSKQLLEEIKSNDPGEPWVGDSIEREWAEAIAHFAKKKIDALAKPGFQRLPQNWLLIYDNWPATGLGSSEGIPYVQEALNRVDSWSSFNRIFIQSESLLIDLSSNDRVAQYDVKHP